MPAFEDHIDQANENLGFLQFLCNEGGSSFLDWKVTVCFYVGVHIVNSHLSKLGLQYKNHREVFESINPKNPLSIAKLPELEYLAYRKLFGLSRRSRYLANEKEESQSAAKTYEKHFVKALRHLHTLVSYCNDSYVIELLRPEINVEGILQKDFPCFNLPK